MSKMNKESSGGDNNAGSRPSSSEMMTEKVVEVGVLGHSAALAVAERMLIDDPSMGRNLHSHLSNNPLPPPPAHHHRDHTDLIHSTTTTSSNPYNVTTTTSNRGTARAANAHHAHRAQEQQQAYNSNPYSQNQPQPQSNFHNDHIHTQHYTTHQEELSHVSNINMEGNHGEGSGSSHSSESRDSQLLATGEQESSESSNSSSGSVVSWISWFCSLPGHEYFIEVPEAWIEDEFNLTGLSSLVPHYSLALDMILDLEEEGAGALDDGGYTAGAMSEEDEELILHNEEFQRQKNKAKTLEVESGAQTLYALIHARFILTKAALLVYKDRYNDQEFGICPRALCGGCPVVPCGMSDFPGNLAFKLYCPRCMDVYHPKQSKFIPIDGCAFGTTFHGLLFNTFPELGPSLQKQSHPVSASASPSMSNTTSGSASASVSGEMDDAITVAAGLAPLQAYKVYTPKIFGFRVNWRATNGPRHGWLRRREGDGGFPPINLDGEMIPPGGG